MVDDAVTIELPRSALAERGTDFSRPPEAGQGTGSIARGCFHCGTVCEDTRFTHGSKVFCCHGCLTVFELLTENGLGSFYQLAEKPGVRARGLDGAGRFGFVDEPAVRERLVDFSDGKMTRLTLRIPAIHCIACVWLLESLHRLEPGIGHSQVNFPRKELSIAFQTAQVRLSEVISLVASLGYEPELKLSDLESQPKSGTPRRLWLQLGLAGFAFGNTMLFSIASYLGLDSGSGPGFRKMVGLISMLLSIPVVTYSARDYWVSAWASLRRRLLNIDVPIAAGILAIFAQSAYDVLTGRGEGYFDSLSGLLFFLLCGRLFQQKTFERLAFDRDYRSFFPLSITRQVNGQESPVALSQVNVGDRLLIRNGELIPADCRLVSGQGLIDYSFVTGESEPVEKIAGDYLYAGGRQTGELLHVETVKAVSQSYLTGLWNQDAFRKAADEDTLNLVTNQYSQRFTKIVLAVAVGSALYWAFVKPALALTAFTSVLIVACPCALALAAPFALGAAQRLLAGRNVFLKNTAVLERLATADAIVFDKTGTLTAAAGQILFHGSPLTSSERRWISSVAAQSTHPHARRVRAALGQDPAELAVNSFTERSGAGMEARVDGHSLRIGSASWVGASGALANVAGAGSRVHVAIDGQHRGWFQLGNTLRPETQQLMSGLAGSYELSLLSGDNDSEEARFREILGPGAALHFNQSPLDKLTFIRRAQERGRTVVMVGDGLNDAGALKQSDIGIAVVEDMSAFSPASDAIMAAEMVPELGRVARFARATVRVVYASFIISTVYNVVGISIAARGQLAPVVCAVLMPLSSVTVVAFACLATAWCGRQILGARAGEANGGPRRANT